MNAINQSFALQERTAMALLLLIALALFGCTPAAGQQDNERIAPLLDGMGSHERTVEAATPLVQRYFNQGLVLSFAFNHAEAARAFREAQRLDSACAMCAWGEALVLGPHVNAPMNAEDVPAAWAALKRAQELAESESPVNQALIQALAFRYAAEPVEDRTMLNRAYADAMRTVAARFPADADVQALFAEALMDTMPWDYWNPDSTPKPETKEALGALENAMSSDPNHPMALHLWIHTVEKPKPEVGIEVAERLGPLVPAAGHLVHMPAHIWIRVGRYHDSVEANRRAAAADDDYLAQCHAQGLYPLGYVPHNHHFLWVSAALSGEKAQALKSAHYMGQHTEMMDMPGMEFVQHFAMSPLYANAVFGEWDAILATPAPDGSLIYPMGVWHFARGVAFARTDRQEEAQQELDALVPLVADTTLADMLAGLNSLHAILGIAERYLAGEVAAARGDYDEAIATLKEAVRLEDALIYDEPPPWALPSRHALGAILLKADHPAEAEQVYHDDLKIYPANGWALYGLAQSLETQGKTTEAQQFRQQFKTAWKHADVTLAASRF